MGMKIVDHQYQPTLSKSRRDSVPSCPTRRFGRRISIEEVDFQEQSDTLRKKTVGGKPQRRNDLIGMLGKSFSQSFRRKGLDHQFMLQGTSSLHIYMSTYILLFFSWTEILIL